MTHTYEQSQPIQHADSQLSSIVDQSNSAVSWSAIFAGAAASASLALILLILGSGLGLISISPWADQGLDAKTFGIATIAWLAFIQIVASGMGGYLAGRLRTKWIDTQTDEIYFRDTVHGFLSWAVASLFSVILLAIIAGTIIGGGTKAIGSVIGSTAITSLNGAVTEGSTDTAGSSINYFIRSLFRNDTQQSRATTPSGTQNATQNNGLQQTDLLSPSKLNEISGIFIQSISTGTLPQEDMKYVAFLISQQTGMSQSEAEQRVQSVYKKALTTLNEAKANTQKAADSARKSASYIFLWTFISLLIGAFVASLCATFGGRQRDL
ncbi:hypothetical protein [Yokenella regensburgei]|uniref:hypothetical protein n=1 Tax=Yokenella regensburgei TaxID=158877 RepID=UPI00137612F8|nr:hypothetical protein [Yokenella regensburgei]KAF1366207.1 hypothetical protein FHR25_005334 [Yokenella regensburgei]